MTVNSGEPRKPYFDPKEARPDHEVIVHNVLEEQQADEGNAGAVNPQQVLAPNVNQVSSVYLVLSFVYFLISWEGHSEAVTLVWLTEDRLGRGFKSCSGMMSISELSL